MSILYGSISKLPLPQLELPNSNVISNPTISAASKEIGVIMSRNIGVYATGWTATAGLWTIYGTSTEIGAQATCDSSPLAVGQYAQYRETISKAGEADQYAYSLPFGPFVSSAPTPPPPAPPPASVITRPSITAPSKTKGVVMTRIIGEYAAGWTPVAGDWYEYGEVTVLSQAATCPSDGITTGGYAIYRETIEHATLPDEYAWSDPFGPFIDAPVSEAIITNPSISAPSKEIGVDMTRNIGVYAAGWTPVAGLWTINGTTTEIGTQATCSSSALSVGEYALYRETIEHATEPDQYAYSLPFGPFVAGPTPPPPPPPPPPGPPPAGGEIYLVQTLIDDMTLPNDSRHWLDRAPYTQGSNGQYATNTAGIKREYGSSPSWVDEYLSDSSMSIPNGSIGMYDSQQINLNLWIVFGRSLQSTTDGYNWRLQTRRHRFYLFYTNNTWELVAQVDAAITGASWHATFSYPGGEVNRGIATGSGLHQIRSETNNGGGESLGHIGVSGQGGFTEAGRYWDQYRDFTYHGYPLSITRSRKTWVDSIRGCLKTCESRLILHDPNGTDDRNKANIMCWIGGDWRDVTNSPSQYISNGDGVGRLKYVRNDWQLHSYHTLTSSILAAYPPPGFFTA